MNFFIEDRGRYQRFQQEFMAQDVIQSVIDEITEQHSSNLEEGINKEDVLFKLLKTSFFGKALKTFRAIIRLCALGYGEDAAILLRSNINLLINVYFILKDDDLRKCASSFIAYSLQKELKYFNAAHEGRLPGWMNNLNIIKIKEQAKKWERNIETRAKRMGKRPSLLFYSMGYRRCSSVEHGDVVALAQYIYDINRTEQLINPAPSDKYIDIVLPYNFYVMADLLVAVMSYFGIQRPDIVEKLTNTWEALEGDAREDVY